MILKQIIAWHYTNNRPTSRRKKGVCLVSTCLWYFSPEPPRSAEAATQASLQAAAQAAGATADQLGLRDQQHAQLVVFLDRHDDDGADHDGDDEADADGDVRRQRHVARRH